MNAPVAAFDSGRVPANAARTREDLGSAIRALAAAGVAPSGVAPGDLRVEAGRVLLVPADADAENDPAPALADLDALFPRSRPRARGGVIIAGTALLAGVVAGAGALLLSGNDRSRDVAAGTVVARIPLGTEQVRGLAVGAGAVWAVAPEGLIRVDTRTNAVAGAPDAIGRNLAGLVFHDGALYSGEVRDQGRDLRRARLVRIDPTTLEVTSRSPWRSAGFLGSSGGVLAGQPLGLGEENIEIFDPRTLALLHRNRSAGGATDVQILDGIAWTVNRGTGIVQRTRLGTGRTARSRFARGIVVRTRAEAARLRARLTEESFPGLAARLSIERDPTAADGEYGEITEEAGSSLTPAQRSVAGSLSPGEISRPMRHRQGWMVLQTREADAPHSTGDDTTGVFAGSEPITVVPTRSGVWVTNPRDGAVLVIAPDGSGIRRVLEVGESPAYAIQGLGSVWVAEADSNLPPGDGRDGVLHRLDPVRGVPLGDPLRLRGRLSWLAAGEGAVWAVDGTDLVRIAPTRNPGERPLSPDDGSLSPGPQPTTQRPRRSRAFSAPVEVAVPSREWFHMIPEDPTALILQWSPFPSYEVSFSLNTPEAVFDGRGGVIPTRDPASFVRALSRNPTVRVRRVGARSLGGTPGIEIEVRSVLPPGAPPAEFCAAGAPCSALFPLRDQTVITTPGIPTRLRVVSRAGGLVVAMHPAPGRIPGRFDQEARVLMESVRFLG